MNHSKKNLLFVTGLFVLVLCCFVGISYKRRPYLINITYQSSQNPEQDGVEKIIISEMEGVRRETTENFVYNEERDRYEYEINGDENTYLNLYLDLFHPFRCNLEYRLRYENSEIDPHDGIAVALYSGSKPVRQQIFFLCDSYTKEPYGLELYIGAFGVLFLISFALCIICALEIVPEKWSYRLIAGAVITGIWSLLWVGGVQTNAMIEEHAFKRYAVFLSVLIFFAVTGSLVRNICSLGKVETIAVAKRIIPAILFLVITCCIYIPSSLFLGNRNEFVMPYYRVTDLVVLYALAVFVVLFSIGLSIREEKGQYIYTLLLFFVTMGFYVQSNFLNPQMPALNGEPIDWNQFRTASIYSHIGWGSLCMILLVLIILGIRKNVKIEKPVRYLALLLSLMQLCSLGVMIFTCRVDPDILMRCGKEGQFEVGDHNVIVFLVDCLQVDAVQTYLQSTENADATLENFTLFTNTIGGGAPTNYAVPTVLTGIEYDPAQGLGEHYEEIWQEGYLLKDLREKKYDVGLYTEAKLLKGIPMESAQNIHETSGNKVGNKILFAQKMLKLTNLYMMPLSLKRYFELDTKELKDCLVTIEEAEIYGLDNIDFYEDFQKDHLSKNKKDTFRFYHLDGVHKPFDNDEKLRRVRKNEELTLQGVMIILKEYMDELKALGVYDNSTIVIFGDHGRHNAEDALKYPAILVKRAGERHPLQYSDHPVCFRNLVATIGSEIEEDYTEYGPGLYDVDQESDVQRLQTMSRDAAFRVTKAGYMADLYADSKTGARFVVDDDGAGNLTYREWNPYEINRVQYNYGDVIDFRSSGGYADSLTDRLYPAERGKTASNELTICFELPDKKTGDLEFGFTYAGVYNNTQKVRIYANGHKIENVMCTTDQIGEETTIVIPKQYVKDKPVILRMVFPNAVTPNQLDRANEDTRVLSVTFDKMWINEEK